LILLSLMIILKAPICKQEFLSCAKNGSHFLSTVDHLFLFIIVASLLELSGLFIVSGGKDRSV
jgi:hypothetical protein